MQHVGLGWRHDELDNGDGTAGVLPLVVIKLPGALDRVEVTGIARGAIEVEVGFQVGEQIAMRAIVRVLPDGAVFTSGQLVHPIVLLEISLNDLDVGGLAHRREVHARVGDHALAALDGEAQQLRQVGTLVKPIRVTSQQFKSF